MDGIVKTKTNHGISSNQQSAMLSNQYGRNRIMCYPAPVGIPTRSIVVGIPTIIVLLLLLLVLDLVDLEYRVHGSSRSDAGRQVLVLQAGAGRSASGRWQLAHGRFRLHRSASPGVPGGRASCWPASVGGEQLLPAVLRWRQEQLLACVASTIRLCAFCRCAISGPATPSSLSPGSDGRCRGGGRAGTRARARG